MSLLGPDPPAKLAAGASGVLMGANKGGIDTVQVPVAFAAGIGRGLQPGQPALPNASGAPAIEPA